MSKRISEKGSLATKVAATGAKPAYAGCRKSPKVPNFSQSATADFVLVDAVSTAFYPEADGKPVAESDITRDYLLNPHSAHKRGIK